VQEAVERSQRLAAQEHRDAGALVRICHVDVTRRQESQQQQQRADDAVKTRRRTSPNIQRPRPSVSAMHRAFCRRIYAVFNKAMRPFAELLWTLVELGAKDRHETLCPHCDDVVKLT